MPLTSEEVISRASRFADANGYRVVPTFDGLVWCVGAVPVKFDAARLIDGDWAVMFDKMLAPGVESECSGDICVVVNAESGDCGFYGLL